MLLFESMIMLLFYRFLFFCLMLAVLVLSLLPLSQDFVTTGWDKTNHLLGFFCLALVMDLAYPKMSFWQAKLLLLLGYGLLIEVLQGFTGYRFFSWLDLLADALGVVLYYPFRELFAGFSDRVQSLWMNK